LKDEHEFSAALQKIDINWIKLNQINPKPIYKKHCRGNRLGRKNKNIELKKRNWFRFLKSINIFDTIKIILAFYNYLVYNSKCGRKKASTGNQLSAKQLAAIRHKGS